MKGLSLFALAIVVGMAAASVFQVNHLRNFPVAQENVKQTTDGAFRDGLYLGRLAAERGSEAHIAVARWATAQDRASFTAGYQRGYNEFLASRMEPATRIRHAE
jgi:hypothetical protein